MAMDMLASQLTSNLTTQPLSPTYPTDQNHLTTTIEIPLKDSDQVIELDLEELPASEEVINILKTEQATLDIWIRIAEAYYTHGQVDDFAEVLEAARSEANLMYEDHERDQVICLDKLAAFYVQKSRKEKNNKVRDELKQNATQLYTMADKISMYDIDHLLGRACFCLQDRTKIDQAEQQFNFVLEHDKHNIKAMLGIAAIQFERKEYKKCLGTYRKALRTNPGCPDPSIRIGLGICFYKLNKMDKAREAFCRALELNKKSVGALCGLAILELNTKSQSQNISENIKQGIQLLSSAYQIENENPLVLIHLADHFFHKREYNRCEKLAMIVIKVSDMDEIKCEAYYQLGRNFHAQEDYENAFSYYYKSTQLALECYQSYVLPFYGLGQLLIQRSKGNIKEHQKIDYLNKAIDCFERVLSKYPNNYESMKILGTLYQYFSDYKPDTKNAREEIKHKPDEAYKKAIENFKKITEIQTDDIEVVIAYAELLQRSDYNAALEQYEIVNKFYREEFNDLPPSEVLNNMANLYMKKQEYGKVKGLFDEALEQLKQLDEDNNMPQGSIDTVALKTTIRYNLGRYYEKINEQQMAILTYKKITKQVPNYIDCYLRLGLIFKSRCYFFDADEWFKEAIAIDAKSADAWALIGNLRFAKKEWGPGQKHFEKIIKMHNADTYSLLSLANLWIEMFYQSSQSVEKSARRLNHSESLFRDILKKDDKNIFAACGIGCILALKKSYSQATEVFTIVREASGAAIQAGDNSEKGAAIHKDVWLNLGHVFCDQQKFAAAVQVYESAIRKYDLQDHEEVLLSYARALFKLSRFDQCRKIVLKARHINPQSQIILYDLAILLKCSSQRVMQSEKSNYLQIKSAVSDLQQAMSYFEYLSVHGEKTVFHFPKLATAEVKTCKDLLVQAEQTLQRAEQIEQQQVRKRLEQQTMKARLRKQLEEEKQERIRKEQEEKEKILLQRKEQLEKTKEIITGIEETPEQFKKRRGGGSDSDDDGGEPKKRGRKKKDKNIDDSDGEDKPKKKSKKNRKKKDSEDEMFIDDEDAAFTTRKSKKHPETPQIKERPGQYKSRAIIEDSSSGSSDDDDQTNRKVSKNTGDGSDSENDMPTHHAQKDQARRKATLADSSSSSSSSSSGSDSDAPKTIKKKSTPVVRKKVSRPADSSSDDDSESGDSDTKVVAKKGKRAAIDSSSDSD